MMHMPNVTGCGDNIAKPGSSFRFQNSKHEIIYFSKGSLTKYHREGQTYPLAHPCVTIMRAGDEYGYTFSPDEPTRHLYINFEYTADTPEQGMSPLLQAGGTSVVNIPESSIIEGIVTHILCLAGKEPAASRERRNRALYLLLGEIEALCQSMPSFARTDLPASLARILEYIEMRLPSPVTVSELVRVSRWSHGHFFREFVRHMGVSPQEYIGRRRIEFACRLLIESDDSIKSVADAAGFEDSHYFSRFFLKFKGVTATQYRERHADVRVRALALAADNTFPYPLNQFIVLD